MRNIKKAPIQVPDELLTTQSVNLQFCAIREQFKNELGCVRPIPFIVWKNNLNEEQEARLQQAFGTRAIKSDAVLIPAVLDTFRWLKRSKVAA